MIAIIDYDAGNLRSIQRALLETGADVTITADPAEIVAADRVVFPGDGHAKTAMDTLHARGLVDAIHTSVNAGKPFLGVCVGMQLLFEEMEEGPTTGLGLLKGSVRKLPNTVKVPQIGWNTVSFREDSPLAHLDGAYFYFVHSFAPQAGQDEDIAGQTDYGVRFTSVVMHDNVWGTQFHPEKSGEDGLDLIRTWAAWGGGVPIVIIYPAIDIRGGRAVRLVEGDFSRETQFDADPVDAARRWQDSGAIWIHIVDLDGARDGTGANRDAIARIRQAVDVQIEVGGGIRTIADLEALSAIGVDRFILGSIAITNPAFVERAIATYGDAIAVGLDARNGKVATQGWLEQTDVDAIEVAQRFAGAGLKHVIFTDILRDGTFQGPNLEALRALIAAVPIDVIASGGVGSLTDVEAIASTGAGGVIIGSALYHGKIALTDALAIGASATPITAGDAQ